MMEVLEGGEREASIFQILSFYCFPSLCVKLLGGLIYFVAVVLTS